MRFQEFQEYRLRAPAKGAVVDEQVDRLLTEPIMPRVQRWIGKKDNIVLKPVITHQSVRLGGGATLIAVAYVLLTVSKVDVVQLVYGT